MDWKERGGCCCEFWWPGNGCGLACFYMLCYCCCNSCLMAKLYASSMHQSCQVINHWWLYCLHPVAVSAITRHNLRQNYGIGDSGWCQDICIMSWCHYCATMQMIRSMPEEDTDWTRLKEVGCCITPWIIAT